MKVRTGRAIVAVIAAGWAIGVSSPAVHADEGAGSSSGFGGGGFSDGGGGRGGGGSW